MVARLPGRPASSKQVAYLANLGRRGYLDIEATVMAWWGCGLDGLSAREASMLIDEQQTITEQAERLGLLDDVEVPRDACGDVYYREYLASPIWMALRERFLAAAGHRCQRCGCMSRLEVHHIAYDTLGEEGPEDVAVLCPKCHKRADLVRRRGTAARREERRRVGWMRAVYGNDRSRWPDGWDDDDDDDDDD